MTRETITASTKTTLSAAVGAAIAVGVFLVWTNDRWYDALKESNRATMASIAEVSDDVEEGRKEQTASSVAVNASIAQVRDEQRTEFSDLKMDVSKLTDRMTLQEAVLRDVVTIQDLKLWSQQLEKWTPGQPIPDPWDVVKYRK